MKIKQQWFARGFTIGHQKVFVDLDFATQVLEGWTEITIIPLSATTDSAAFHCWQSEITNCEVDGHGASWQHIDGLRDLQLREQSASVHQHEALRSRFAALNRTINRCDLHIRFPPQVKVETQDRDSGTATHDIHTSGANENGNDEEIEAPTPAVMPTPSTPFGTTGSIPGGIQYKPITVKIWFRCPQPLLGLRFQNCNDSSGVPHAYTVNSPVPCSTSLWLPCLDGIWERCTWEISVRIPKTTGDIGRRSPSQGINGHAGISDLRTSSKHRSNIADEEEYMNPTDTLVMTVVCSADFVEEVADLEDSSLKILSYAQSSPIGASHIAFAVGPFAQFNLSEFREAEEDDLMGSSAVDVYGYCLPDKLQDLKSSCFPLYKAMDFFVKEYGSYPFNNYQICFVQGMEVDSINAAGMSLASEQLLYDERSIDPIYPVTKGLVNLLAAQWVGVNIVPRSWSDMWLILGLSYYITGLFLRKLMGNNDYRFRLKQDVVAITEQDVGKPPLSSRDLEIPIDVEQTRFLILKAPVVLHMLEQRLARAGSNLALGRVIPRIFLQALSGELANGILSTEKFLKQCEKVSHVKLEDFARQWIFGHGYPKFSVVQRFNKKKMVIEMGIRQQQFQDAPRTPLRESTFVDDAYRVMSKPLVGAVEAVFTGPMTIRIHEADGTPYEHVIDLKDQYHKFDIPYNNKYRKRIRTRKLVKSKLGADLPGTEPEEIEEDTAEQEHINCLGDGFQTEQDHEIWGLEDWSKENEDKMSGEAFEWIRLDSGFEWICTMQVGQPDYMYHSQLQQDRDVVAQFEAIQYYQSIKPNAIIATILFRTVMDDRYYHGIRQSAASALVRCASPEIDMRGENMLLGIFRKLFCYADTSQFIPKPNDFRDFALYFLRSTILDALTAIRVKEYSPAEIRSLLIAQIRYNDNSSNDYDDTQYICKLIRSLATALIHDNPYNLSTLLQDKEFLQSRSDAITEIERCQRMDRWRPSYQNIITRAALESKERLMQTGMMKVHFKEFMDYTREEHFSLVRLQAYSSMLNIGALRQGPLTKYILYMLGHDPSSMIRHRLSQFLKLGIGYMALRSKPLTESDHAELDAMVIEEDTSAAVELRKDKELRMSINGALLALRTEFSEDEDTKAYMWQSTNDWRLAPILRRNLLDICKILYETRESRVLKFKIPKMKARLAAKHLGNGKVVLKKVRPLEAYQKKAPIKPIKIKLKLMNGNSRRESAGEQKTLSA